VLIIGFDDHSYDDSALFAGIGDDLTKRLFERSAHLLTSVNAAP
jgi:hypothetical protein